MKVETIVRTKTNIIDDEVQFSKKGKFAAVHITSKVNGKVSHKNRFFTTIEAIEKSQRGKNPTIATFNNIPLECRYNLYDVPAFDCVVERFKEGSTFYLELSKSLIDMCDVNCIKLLLSSDFKKSLVLRYDSSNHLFYKIGSNIPMSMPYHISYIGGVTNGNFDLSVAKRILEKHPWVSNVNHIDIPYYNAEKDCDEAIEFAATLPQRKLNQIVTLLRDDLKIEYWSSRLKDVFSNFFLYDDCPDVLGLGKALKPKGQREYD